MDNVLQHFRADEREFIEQVIEWKRQVEDFYAPKTTPFLDPRQMMIVQSIIGTTGDVQVAFHGGFVEDAERKRALLYPSYVEPTIDEFQLTLLCARYPSKFVQLKHPDVLGALLSLGLERAKFGDIRVGHDVVQFVVAAEVADYVRANLTSIAKSKVNVQEVAATSSLLQAEEKWQESVITSSSLRLDTVIASSYPAISRQKAVLYIESGKVKVNYAVREQPSFELHEADLVSIRGVGRLFIASIEGRTKKEKLRLKIGKMERK
ncbi:RNA-binding protein [Kurthia huakuii]|uniref:YlmH family RNA-binding protein n=1 Tax=Kurthia huakuii TaxID=1421019 RepID=UPI000494F46E|nr:RNA-binding protein [Kurthia huakuii]MBM7698403.1 RNA-binding protein YlmH [Kurthia huakuii]